MLPDFACEVYLYLCTRSTDTIIMWNVLSEGERLLMRIIKSQLANFLNCEEVRDTIEKQKKVLTSRETTAPL